MLQLHVCLLDHEPHVTSHLALAAALAGADLSLMMEYAVLACWYAIRPYFALATLAAAT